MDTERNIKLLLKTKTLDELKQSMLKKTIYWNFWVYSGRTHDIKSSRSKFESILMEKDSPNWSGLCIGWRVTHHLVICYCKRIHCSSKFPMLKQKKISLRSRHTV